MLRSRETHFNLRIFEDGSFLTMKAAETLCTVCLPPEEHIS